MLELKSGDGHPLWIGEQIWFHLQNGQKTHQMRKELQCWIVGIRRSLKLFRGPCRHSLLLQCVVLGRMNVYVETASYVCVLVTSADKAVACHFKDDTYTLHLL